MSDLREGLEKLAKDLHDRLQLTTGWVDLADRWQSLLADYDEALQKALLAEAREGGKPEGEKCLECMGRGILGHVTCSFCKGTGFTLPIPSSPSAASTEGPGLPVGYMWKSSPGQEWEDTHFSATLPEFSTATWFLEAVSNGYCTAVVPLYARVEGEKQ